MFHYIDRLHAAIRAKGTPALVGIDPRWDRLPSSIVEFAVNKHGETAAAKAAAFTEFSFRLIDVVAGLVPAIKPQSAFFEELGPLGGMALSQVIKHGRNAGLIVICDAKRGDIGSTAEAYARGYLAGADPDAAAWSADALTVNPYLGADTLKPFVDVAVERGAGIYVLVRTSNPGAGLFQDRERDPVPLYRTIAETVEALAVETAAGDYGSVGAVVGATAPRELIELRDVMPHAPFLVPGYGAQGGGADDVAGAFRADGLGALVNSSRAINFAYQAEPFASEFGEARWEDAAEAATRQMIADLATIAK
jgi:orotidine-5'-phosphate decarboxylase